jgi:hypothetical protein
MGMLIAGITLRDKNSENWLWEVLVVLAILFFGWGIWGNRQR